MASTARQAMAESPEARQALLARLRADIKKVQAAPRKLVLGLSCGVAELDELGLFRLGAAVELCGEEASGRTSLALHVVASACREKRLAAWVDGPAELYPPAAVPLGVELSRLLIVRPKAPGQLVWSAVQLLRSGAFASVVLDVTHTGLKLNMLDARKLIDAARAGGAVLVVLTGQASPAQGMLRLQCGGRAPPALDSARAERVGAESARVLPFAPSRGAERGGAVSERVLHPALDSARAERGGAASERVLPFTPSPSRGAGDAALDSARAERIGDASERVGAALERGLHPALDSARAERGGDASERVGAAFERVGAAFERVGAESELVGAVSERVLPFTPSPSRGASDAGLDDRGQLHLALVHGGGGTEVDVARQALCPRGRTRRATHVSWPGLALPAQSAEPGLQRPRRNLERDGYVPGGPQGLRHGRPGRDTKLSLPLPRHG